MKIDDIICVLIDILERIFHLKRGCGLKKIVNFSLWMLGVFLYLVYMMQLQNHDIDMVIIIGYFEGIIKVVLGICGIVLTYNTMKIKINNKANFISISALSISIFTILKLWFYIGHSNSVFLMEAADKFKWIIEYLEIISLVICINYIDEKTSLKVWGWIYGIICGVGMSFVWISFKIPFKIAGYSDVIWIKDMMEMSCILLVSVAYGINYKKIKELPSFERKIIDMLFSVKILGNVLGVFSLRGYHPSIHIVYHIVQMIFSLLIVVYIDELTLSMTWKKIDLGVQNKNEQATRGYAEQRTLVTVASEIQRIIESINKKTFNLEKEIASGHSSHYIKYIDKIQNNCCRLLKLSANILDLNTYEGGSQTSRFEIINLTALIGGVVESLETYIMQRGIQIVFTASNECIMAEVDKDAVERILLNLLSNAVKYNRINGTIKVIVTEKKKIIYLCIQDTGIGIPSHYLDLIFEKFQRVNAGLAREQEGSGLGLSIVKSLVDIHHGEIKIVSRENRGTLISVGLPITQEEKVDRKKCKKSRKNNLHGKIQLEFSDLEKC